MKCSSPISTPASAYPCGKCMGCRVNKASKWTAKLLMEAQTQSSKFNYFVTFTYNDEHLPADGSINKRDGSEFRKRLREVCPGVRFFWVGEYGEDMDRPHYHAILFGIDPFLNITETLEELWTHGFISVAHLNPARAGYVAQYCMKKINGNIAADHYQGKLPEFSQMSRRPALGDQCLLEQIAPFYKSRAGQATIVRNLDVSHVFRLGGRIYPLTNRHVRMLRKEAGLPELTGDEQYRPLPPPLEDMPDLGELQARKQKELQRAKKAEIHGQQRQRVDLHAARRKGMGRRL